MKEKTIAVAFKGILRGQVTRPPPVWLMRQAGRYLPEYQKIRKRVGSFWTMCMSPDLAQEITLQPIERFDFDAAIIFSDILVVPYALGQKVRFEDGIGPILDVLGDVTALIRDRNIWAEKLAPVYQALTATRASLSSKKILIGFAGAPWTLAAYMIEGRGTPDQKKAKLHAYQEPKKFLDFLEILSDAVATHLIRQIDAGADVVQIFDSWAGGLNERNFSDWVIAPTKKIVISVRAHKPDAYIIGFPRAATQTGYERYIAETGVSAVGIDTATPLSWAAKALGGQVAIQGNLDPLALVAGGDTLSCAIDDVLQASEGVPFIFNLGHGVLPETPVDHVAQLVAQVRRAVK